MIGRSFFILVFFVLIMGVELFASEELKAPKIVLEEMNVTFLQEGREVRKISVSEDEWMSILNDVKAKVLKKLGADTLKEIMEKGMMEQFDQEIEKLVKKERITPSLLIFYDNRGAVVKKMVMHRPGKKRSEGGIPKTSGSIYRDALVSKDGSSAVVTEYSAGAVLETWSNIALYDVDGHAVWEESTPEHMYVKKMVISKDGKIVAFIQIREQGGTGEDALSTILRVFDRVKKELLNFPGKGDASYSASSGFLRMSPGGRYLSVAATKGGGEKVNLFFDIVNNTRWEAPEEYFPESIDDLGNVYTEWRDKGDGKLQRQVLELKRHLGE